ncbi:MAG: hypothetical protein HOV94_30085 [Saccharothrix sp.]|nr:hypothetical protein [Saccharothrix sp.]
MVQAVSSRRRGQIAVMVSSGVGVATGLWLMVSPLVLGYSSHGTSARWTDLGVGGVVVLVTVSQVVVPRRPWPTLTVLGVVSAWLLLAPTLLDLRTVERAAAVNDLLTGALLAVVVLLHVAGLYIRDSDSPEPRA